METSSADANGDSAVPGRMERRPGNPGQYPVESGQPETKQWFNHIQNVLPNPVS